MRKRIVATVLALCLVLGLVPGTAWAVEMETSGKCGKNATWSFDAATETLTISGTGAMDDYSCEWYSNPPPYIGWNGYEGNYIRSVVVSEGITHIGSDAFGSFTMFGILFQLKHVKLPRTLKSIGTCAFANAESLTSIVLPDGLVSIDSYAFSGTKLTSLHLPASLKEIGYEGLGSGEDISRITVASGNPQYAAVDGVLYWVNSSSWEIALYPGKNTRTEYTIPTQVSELYEGVLSNKEYLRTIAVPSTVKTIPAMAFMNCPNLSSIILPEGLISVDPSAFWWCTSLSKLEIPSSVTSFTTDIGPGDGWNGDTSNLAVYFKSSSAPKFDASISELKYAGDESGKVTIYYPTNSSGWESVQNQEDVKLAIEEGLMEFRTWDPNPELDNKAKIVKLYPQNGAANVDYKPSDAPKFQIAFDRGIVNDGAVADVDLNLDNTFAIYRASDDKLIYKATPSLSTERSFKIVYKSENILSIEWFGELEPDTTYYITMGEGFVRFKDGSTNLEIKKGDWEFTTRTLAASGNFRFLGNNDTTMSYTYSYSDDYFKKSSYNYDHDLANMSISLALSAFNAEEILQNGYDDSDNLSDADKIAKDNIAAKNVVDLLEQIGFGEKNNQKKIDISGYGKAPEKNSIGVAIASKPIKHDSDEYTLVVAAVRGSGYQSEWGGNAYVGDSGNHKGFQIAADQIVAKLKDYIYRNGIHDKLKIWITGYSRAAATANLAAGALDDGALFKGHNALTLSSVQLDPSDIYAYTFETPMGVLADDDSVYLKKYTNIFNIVNPIDLVPKVAPEGWSFARYGVDQFLPTAETTYNYYNTIKDVRKKYNEIVYGPNSIGSLPITFLNNQSTILDNFIKSLAEELPRKVYSPAYEALASDFLTELFKSPNKADIKDAILNFAASYPLEAAALVAKVGDIAGRKVTWYIITGQGFEQLYKALGIEGTTAIDLLAEILAIVFQSHYPTITLAWMRTVDVSDFQTVRRIVHIDCPVDVSVYDSADQLVAQIINEDAKIIEGSTIGSYVDGDGTKIVILPTDEEYRVVVDATDNGVVTYTVDEYNLGTNTEKRLVSYENVAINTGDTLTGKIEDLEAVSSATYPLYRGNETTPLLPTVDRGGTTPVLPEPDQGEDTTSYISIPTFPNGSITPTTRNASPDDRVTLYAHPDAGYELDTLTVTDIRGRNIPLRSMGDNAYSFLMPAARVTVDASFVKVADNTPTTPAEDEIFTGLGTPGISGIVLNPAPMPFTDVQPQDWFYDNVDYVWKHYLMSGVTETQFSPNVTTSRAMIWTILARMNNVKANGTGSLWYEKGLLWAKERGVTDGTDPMGDITREQLATMLWRNAGRPAPGAAADLSRFSDSSTVSEYAQTAVRWAASVGILNGSDGRIDPQGTATRAQVAAMVARYGDRIA